MEGQSFVVNGGVKMPIGYRFHPTDEELVVHYLKRKAFNLPLPASVIPEFDVLQTDPWNLPGDVKENKYVFSKRYGNDSNNKCKRVAGRGYWKPIGKEKPILASGTSQVIGMRKALVFCERKPSNETKTRWLLHQFRLVDSAETLYPTQMFKREWLVFKVIQRERRGKKHGCSRSPTSSAVHIPSCIDFTVEDSSVFGPPPQPTSPSSSESC
ncbi:VND-interacting 2, NAC domain containing protein 83 [Hibiscus trionum]|uniref:VND-interacting 2, NAC domain containing protein 83 n=1 Tax=Hibiscus trionum TaxID=183268 RepID=A0A9W7M3C1_HIBTR|nr:VND-interacting 2, NAC domain containing protein 83 [Hibiscus trionum]